MRSVTVMATVLLLSGCGELKKAMTRGGKCTKAVFIASVGGCTSDGICGVMYSDATFGKQYLPIVHQPVIVSTECGK